MNKVDSQMFKTGIFNFQGSNYSRGDFSVATILLGNSRMMSRSNRSNNSNSSGVNNQKDKASNDHKRSVKRRFSRFRTIGNTGKISQDSS